MPCQEKTIQAISHKVYTVDYFMPSMNIALPSLRSPFLFLDKLCVNQTTGLLLQKEIPFLISSTFKQ